MASTWSLTVNGEKYRLAEGDADRLRDDVANAVRRGGDWVSIPPKGLDESVEVFITTSSQVVLRLTKPSPPPMAVGMR